MHGCYPSYAGPCAEQQRAGFCGMVRLGCGPDPRNSDALTQKHSNWKARRAKNARPSRPRQVGKAMRAHFQEIGGDDLVEQRRLDSENADYKRVSLHYRQLKSTIVGNSRWSDGRVHQSYF